MKTIFISEITNIKDGDQVEDIFLVKVKQQLLRKDGRPYLMLKVCDRTGIIDGKVWDNVEELTGRFAADDIVMIKGVMSSYKGTKEINIKAVEKIADEVVDLSDFIAVSEYDFDALEKRLLAVIGNLKNPFLKKLLTLFYEDKEFMGLFRTAPAAKEIHHAFLGGLLEHSLEIVDLCKDMKNHYDEIDLDLLVTGAILHDVGKVRELKFNRSLDYTDEGRLVGHIMIGVEMVDERIRLIRDFPVKLAMLLRHLIVSHQGTYEWGSPKVPQTLEAIILHNLDDLSAKVNVFRKAVLTDTGEGDFTSYNKPLDRYLYKSGNTE
ncbi:MAG: HD domain-containing protein [Nitrospirae bacterium]|nr:HD domain-containing protein [Nitrospirota bacterium]